MNAKRDGTIPQVRPLESDPGAYLEQLVQGSIERDERSHDSDVEMDCVAQQHGCSANC